jgi:hypothetical protein
VKLLAAGLLGLTALVGFTHQAKRIVIVDHTWTCTSHVDLDLVQVTMTPQSIGERSKEDAVHLRSGCTGRIGKLVVEQWAGDGVKVAQGVHDLTVEGGSIRCHAKAPDLHQDGIQALGGSHVLFRDLTIDCGREQARLVNSNFFVSEAGKSTSPPTDIVCDGCRLGSWAAHTVSIQRSASSGVRNSTLCYARFPQLTLTIGPEASRPVSSGNHLRQCGAGRLVLEHAPGTARFRGGVRLTGLFEAEAPGMQVVVEARPFGAKRFRQVAATTTSPNGRFRLVFRPRISATLRVRSGVVHGPVVKLGVRPVVHLRQAGSGLLATVRAARSYAGRTATMQESRNGGWVTVQRVRLGRSHKTRFSPRVRHANVRLRVPPAPGYLAATSEPVTLR